MAEQPTDNKHERDTSSYVGVGLSLGAGLGVAFGAALGAATDNMGFWVGMGVAMGTAMGVGGAWRRPVPEGQGLRRGIGRGQVKLSGPPMVPPSGRGDG